MCKNLRLPNNFSVVLWTEVTYRQTHIKTFVFKNRS